MKPNASERGWDVLIVAPIGVPGDFAHALRAALAESGIGVKLDIVSDQRMLPLPAACTDDAKRARFCVVLGMVGATTHYALMPAPRFEGQEPDIAPMGSKAGPGQVEIGVLTEDVAAFADRIAARVRPISG